MLRVIDDWLLQQRYLNENKNDCIIVSSAKFHCKFQSQVKIHLFSRMNENGEHVMLHGIK